MEERTFRGSAESENMEDIYGQNDSLWYDRNERCAQFKNATLKLSMKAHTYNPSPWM